VLEIDSPSKLPDPGRIVKIEEPIIRAMISDERGIYRAPAGHCSKKSIGIQLGFEYLTTKRVLADLRASAGQKSLWISTTGLKSLSRGYASLDYEFTGYREGDLEKLDILVAGEQVDALSISVHRDVAYERDGLWLEKNAQAHARGQLFEVGHSGQRSEIR